MKHKTQLVTGVLLLFYSSFALALNWNLFYRLCPEAFIEVPPLIEDFPIPVGCEVIDCCPGCPGPGFVDWRISLDGEVYAGADLRFVNLGPEQLRSLKIDGDVKFEKDRLILGTGETRIFGLPLSVDGEVPVAYISPQPQDTGDTKSPEDGGSGIQAIAVDQYVGGVRVNRFRVRYGFRFCPSIEILTDKLRIDNNTSNDITISMIDFRSGSVVGGCRNDQMVRTSQEANMGSVLTNGTCNSEVAVFSDDNAMAFDTPVTTWTDPLGDVHTVNLQPIINVPVSVWVTNAGAAATAVNDFANANLLYNQNNVGVQFQPNISDVSGNAAAVAAIGTNCPTAATIGALQGSAWYTAGQLNVYYANRAFTGVNCNSDQNVSYLGTTANLGSLPHEIGHAYGLRTQAANWGHTNGLVGFGNNNIMWGGGPATRDQFSVGQSFRINTHTSSRLNVNGDRAGTTRNCETNVSSNLCPEYALDSLPH